jgi:hypothetical protein
MGITVAVVLKTAIKKEKDFHHRGRRGTQRYLRETYRFASI